MASTATELGGLRARLDYTGRQFHAWWEGYAFDRDAERAAVAAKHAGVFVDLPANEVLTGAIWGEARAEPGSPSWTLRFAQLLSLPLKAQVTVFGSSAGALLDDLSNGTRWKMMGFSRGASRKRRNLHTYDDALNQISARPAQGGLCFFELGMEKNPAAFAALCAQAVVPGATVVFIEYVAVRRGVRLRGCFPDRPNYGVRNDTEFEKMLREAGFSIADTRDETSGFMGQITAGWAGWRSAYDAIRGLEDGVRRAELMHELAREAKLWAERFDAMKSGQLRVVAFRAIRKSD